MGDHAVFKISQQQSGQTKDVLRETLRDRERILSPFADEEALWAQRLVFDHSHDTPLLEVPTSGAKQKTQSFSLSYADSVQQPTMGTPAMKAVSSNAEIGKSLLDYVIGTSMKGGKHARIDSLHSISRGTQSRLKHKSKIIKSSPGSPPPPPVQPSLDENAESDHALSPPPAPTKDPATE